MGSRTPSSPRKASGAIWLVIGLFGCAILLDRFEDGVGSAPDAAMGTDASGQPKAAVAASPTTTEETTSYEVTATSLRLRSGPSTTSSVRGAASRGDRVEVLGKDGGWLDVRLRDGARGWMSGSYLASVGVAVAPGAASPPDTTLERSTLTDAVGRATVTDGDTIVIGGIRIRLEGIDAPESGQTCEDAAGRLYPCGGRAANALDALIGRGTVACRRNDTDRYGRMVATCEMLATAESLNARMVREGWAMAYRRYSMAYVLEEDAARAARQGLWQGEFVPPWDYRAGKRLSRSGTSAATEQTSMPTDGEGSCLIKGNITDAGHIYHLPGSKWYDKTRIDTGHGERWFCSEDEARAAGWRAPRG